jgi:glycosyltransferase involved in cell wall biosynthesis
LEMSNDRMAPGNRSELRVSYDATAVPTDPVGAGRYTIELARALGSTGEVNLDVWCRSDDGSRMIAATGGGARLLPRAPTNRVARLVWEQLRLPGAIDRLGVDVHHSPHYTMPERAKTPVVVTVHDVTFIEHPEWHEKSKVIFFRRALSVAARKAEVVVCVSESTADRFTAMYRPRGEVVVVPHGVDTRRFHPRGPVDDEPDQVVLKRLNVEGRYVLFVGTLEPRKAVPDLVAAFGRVAEKDRDISLVLAGGRGWGADAVDKAIAGQRDKDRIRVTGYVTDEEVAVLMRNAAAVVYPAIEEGFGLPALEALASGAPLVTTAGSVMADVAGSSALLVRAEDPQGLAEAIDEAVAGGAAVRQRVSVGLERARARTWEASALGHLKAYRKAARGRGSA